MSYDGDPSVTGISSRRSQMKNQHTQRFKWSHYHFIQRQTVTIISESYCQTGSCLRFYASSSWSKDSVGGKREETVSFVRLQSSELYFILHLLYNIHVYIHPSKYPNSLPQPSKKQNYALSRNPRIVIIPPLLNGNINSLHKLPNVILSPPKPLSKLNTRLAVHESIEFKVSLEG